MSASLIQMGPTRYFNEEGVALKFTPAGKVYEIGDASSWYTRSYKENPIKSAHNRSVQGARIIVGFNVGIEEKWKMDDIIDIVFDVRRQQVESAIEDKDAKPHPLGGDVGVTFLAQKGIWQAVREKKVYPENGAQVMIMNIIAEKKSRFRDDMVEIAEELARKLKQNAVIVEMSKNGAIQETLEVVA